MNRDENSLAGIFANAEQIAAVPGEKHPLATNLRTPFHLTRDDSVINGSQNPCENLNRVGRIAMQLIGLP